MYRTLYLRSTSPDGVAEVTVWSLPHPPDTSLAISVTTSSGTRQVYQDTKDRALRLTEVYWSKDARLVGVLVCDAYSTDLVFAYDVRAGRTALPGEVIEGLRTAVRQRYAPTDAALNKHDGDPLQWACESNSGALDLFYGMMPESRNLPTLVPRRP